MNIAVWCGCEPSIPEVYVSAAKQVGELIARRGHTIVYGGSSTGLMGAVADACLEAGGEVIGVQVDIPRIAARRHQGLTRLINTPDMATRKATMIELADAYISLPGGIGTLDETFEVLALLRSGVFDKPCALLNTQNFYNAIAVFFRELQEKRFADESVFKNVLMSENPEEIIDYFEHFSA